MCKFITLLNGFRYGVVVAVGLMLAACATAPPADDPEALSAYQEANDPMEPLNRAIFDFNLGIDKLLFRPIAEIYDGAVPDVIKDSVRNFLDNLRSPIIFVNDLLQGEIDRAGETFGRFVANTFIGVGGLFDVMPDVERHDEDFGQTFAVWGIPEGPYLVLPILGPLPPRAAVGRVIEWFVDPVNIAARNNDEDDIPLLRSGLDALDFRAANIETLDEIERTSIDFYAAIRSLYRQRRADEIRNGEPAPAVSMKEINFDEDDEDEKPKKKKE